MSDARLRDAERRWSETGADDDLSVLVIARKRAGLEIPYGMRVRMTKLFSTLGKNKRGLEEFRHKTSGMIFVMIPAGEFMMGRNDEDTPQQRREFAVGVHQVLDVAPQQRREFAEPFLVAKYPWTGREWYRTTGEFPSHFPTRAMMDEWMPVAIPEDATYGPEIRMEAIDSDGKRWGDHPVESVSWDRCRQVEDHINRVDFVRQFNARFLLKNDLKEHAWVNWVDYTHGLASINLSPAKLRPDGEVVLPHFAGLVFTDEVESLYQGWLWNEDNERAGFQLPTESMWEYAARAGTTTRYPNGDTDEDLAKIAWFGGDWDDGHKAVGLKDDNNWGLHDNCGNVFEWTRCMWRQTVEENPVNGFLAVGEECSDPTVTEYLCDSSIQERVSVQLAAPPLPPSNEDGSQSSNNPQTSESDPAGEQSSPDPTPVSPSEGVTGSSEQGSSASRGTPTTPLTTTGEPDQPGGEGEPGFFGQTPAERSSSPTEGSATSVVPQGAVDTSTRSTGATQGSESSSPSAGLTASAGESGPQVSGTSSGEPVISPTSAPDQSGEDDSSDFTQTASSSEAMGGQTQPAPSTSVGDATTETNTTPAAGLGQLGEDGSPDFSQTSSIQTTPTSPTSRETSTGPSSDQSQTGGSHAEETSTTQDPTAGASSLVVDATQVDTDSPGEDDSSDPTHGSDTSLSRDSTPQESELTTSPHGTNTDADATPVTQEDTGPQAPGSSGEGVSSDFPQGGQSTEIQPSPQTSSPSEGGKGLLSSIQGSSTPPTSHLRSARPTQKTADTSKETSGTPWKEKRTSSPQENDLPDSDTSSSAHKDSDRPGGAGDAVPLALRSVSTSSSEHSPSTTAPSRTTSSIKPSMETPSGRSTQQTTSGSPNSSTPTTGWPREQSSSREDIGTRPQVNSPSPGTTQPTQTTPTGSGDSDQPGEFGSAVPLALRSESFRSSETASSENDSPRSTTISPRSGTELSPPMTHQESSSSEARGNTCRSPQDLAPDIDPEVPGLNAPHPEQPGGAVSSDFPQGSQPCPSASLISQDDKTIAGSSSVQRSQESLDTSTTTEPTECSEEASSTPTPETSSRMDGTSGLSIPIFPTVSLGSGSPGERGDSDFPPSPSLEEGVERLRSSGLTSSPPSLMSQISDSPDSTRSSETTPGSTSQNSAGGDNTPAQMERTTDSEPPGEGGDSDFPLTTPSLSYEEAPGAQDPSPQSMNTTHGSMTGRSTGISQTRPQEGDQPGEGGDSDFPQGPSSTTTFPRTQTPGRPGSGPADQSSCQSANEAESTSREEATTPTPTPHQAQPSVADPTNTQSPLERGVGSDSDQPGEGGDSDFPLGSSLASTSLPSVTSGPPPSHPDSPLDQPSSSEPQAGSATQETALSEILAGLRSEMTTSPQERPGGAADPDTFPGGLGPHIDKWAPLLSGIDETWTRTVAAAMLENESRHLQRLQSEVDGEGVGPFLQYALPLIRRASPLNFPYVQPMLGPIGGMAFYRPDLARRRDPIERGGSWYEDTGVLGLDERGASGAISSRGHRPAWRSR